MMIIEGLESVNKSKSECKSKNENNKSCCTNTKLIMDNATGEMFCGNCGYVVSERIEELGPEWRAHNMEEYEERSRTGIPTSLAMHDMGLATVIGPDKDAEGKPLSTALRSTIERLRIWDSRIQNHKAMDRNLKQAFLELDRLKDKLAVGESVIEKAAYIYRKALEKGLVRGRSISALVAAALYAACREAEIPRTLKDIADASNIKKKEISRYYKLLIRELDLQIPVVDPIKCISRIANKAGITERTKRKAIEILNKAKEAKITVSKDPMGLAGSALYIACIIHGENKTQEEIAEVAGVTAVTVRNRYRELKELLTNFSSSNNGNSNNNNIITQSQLNLANLA